MVENRCAQTVPAKRLYSIKELVAYFGVTPWYWRSQIWGGQLAFVQVGRKMLIDHRDVESFINKHKTSNI
jgi:excisionase family DNA binding protein